VRAFHLVGGAHQPDGKRTVLASHYEGRELNSPNDVIVGSDNAIWFTDPWYGRMPGFGVERPRELGWQGVFRIPPGQVGGEPQLVVDRYQFSMPNGLCFSPDEKLLYINDTEQANIRVFDVEADGKLSRGRTFASGIKDTLKPGVPDGMKCDASGNVWVTAPGGIWVYDPQGRLIGKIAIPELVANIHWGGENWRTLFICATHSLYSVETKVGPRNEPFMRAAVADAPLGPAASACRSSDCCRHRPRPRPGALRPHHPGHAERRRHGRRRVCRLRRAAALPRAELHREHPPPGRALPPPRRARHPRVVRRRARRPGMTLNAPLFEGVVSGNAMVRDTWGVQPVSGLEPQPGDHVVRKMRMSAWEGTSLETILKAEGRDVLIETGAWTNMSIEHTARTGADKGYVMVIPEDGCSTMNADWHNASINYALQNVAAVTKTHEVISALG
jgi:gluconolactonase